MSAYSKTPLFKKLGIKSGFKILVKDAPQSYEAYFEKLPSPLKFLNSRGREVDFIHLFVTSKRRLERHYPSLFKALKKDGLLWISWPKGGSDIETDLNRDYIRSYVLDNGLVDVKVCSIDDQWSGLKFVYRTKDR